MFIFVRDKLQEILKKVTVKHEKTIRLKEIIYRESEFSSNRILNSRVLKN